MYTHIDMFNSCNDSCNDSCNGSCNDSCNYRQFKPYFTKLKLLGIICRLIQTCLTAAMTAAITAAMAAAMTSVITASFSPTLQTKVAQHYMQTHLDMFNSCNNSCNDSCNDSNDSLSQKSQLLSHSRIYYVYCNDTVIMPNTSMYSRNSNNPSQSSNLSPSFSHKKC